MTRDEALAYFTPHPLTKGPVMLDPEKMREAVAVLASIGAPDPDIAGLELTEHICFAKMKRERDAYRAAQAALLNKFEDMTRLSVILLACGEMTAQERRTASAVAKWYLATARSLLSQPTEGE